jgi:hypothetical protein
LAEKFCQLVGAPKLLTVGFRENAAGGGGGGDDDDDDDDNTTVIICFNLVYSIPLCVKYTK